MPRIPLSAKFDDGDFQHFERTSSVSLRPMDGLIKSNYSDSFSYTVRPSSCGLREEGSRIEVNRGDSQGVGGRVLVSAG